MQKFSHVPLGSDNGRSAPNGWRATEETAVERRRRYDRREVERRERWREKAVGGDVRGVGARASCRIRKGCVRAGEEGFGCVGSDRKEEGEVRQNTLPRDAASYCLET